MENTGTVKIFGRAVRGTAHTRFFVNSLWFNTDGTDAHVVVETKDFFTKDGWRSLSLRFSPDEAEAIAKAILHAASEARAKGGRA